MRRFLFIVIALTTTNLFIFSCSKNKTYVPKISVNPEKIYYIVNESGFSSGSFQVKSFDPVSHVFNSENKASADTSDALGFFSRSAIDGSINSILIVERFLSLNPNNFKPSRVTYYDQSSARENSRDLPQNIYSITTDGSKNNLVFLGFDKKEIAVTTPDLSQVVQKHTAVSGLPDGGGYQDSFVEFLQNSTKDYVLTLGYNYVNQANHVANLCSFTNGDYLSLASGCTLIQIDETHSCKDIYSTQKLSRSQIVVACNPYYSANIQPDQKKNTHTDCKYKDSLFLIDVSSGSPVVKLIKEVNNCEVITNNDEIKTAIENHFTLGGVSKDYSSVFVTETEGVYEHPKIFNTYLINPFTLQTTNQLSTVSGDVFYSQNSDSYVFSCSVNSNSRTCAQNTISMINAGDLTSAPQTYVSQDSLENIKFFKEIF